MHEELRKAVCDANIELPKHNLVLYSWGNVSAIDRSAGVVAIKPSGVAYNDLTPQKIVLLDLDGNVVEGDLNPSSDTPTHLELYRNFDAVAGICHNHSPAATALATITINPQQGPITKALLDKHYLRKHGKDAYYGQRKKE